MVSEKILKFIGTILILSLVASCDRAADVSIPVSYNKKGVNFSYPSNWKITEDDEQNDIRYVLLESPGNAIFIIQVYLSEDAVSIREYAEWFSEEAIKETPIFERTEGSFTKVKAIVDGKEVPGLRQDFSINVFSLPVPHVSEYYRIEKGNKVAFLISQAAEDDLKYEAEGFELLIKSFQIKI